MAYGAMTLGTINGDAESYACSVGAKSSRGDWLPCWPLDNQGRTGRGVRVPGFQLDGAAVAASMQNTDLIIDKCRVMIERP